MVSTDFNMLRLEAPRDVLQINDGTEQAEETLEVTNPATWLRALAKQQSKQNKTWRNWSTSAETQLITPTKESSRSSKLTETYRRELGTYTTG